MTVARPNFCPNCGATLPEGSHGAQEFSRTTIPPTTDTEVGWDCYCDACKWSGDILPDDEEERP